MKKSSVVPIIIFLMIIMMLTIGGVIFLYLTTDMFKSNEELFKKYMAQNVSNIYKVIDISEEEELINLLGKSDYTEKTEAKLTYLEKENDEQEVYEVKEVGIIKNSEENSYRKANISYQENLLMSIDLLHKKDVYGFRLANLVNQFVSLKNATISYFVSSLGYDGKYFSEKMQGVDVSEIMNFTDEEIETLANTYSNVIFADINKKNYSSTSALITLNNGQSIETKAYTLKITKNELDKIYKRTLNTAVSDKIILSKLEQLDSKITEMGFVQPEGESIKEIYIAKLQSIADQIEYEGTDTTPVTFSVYEISGETLRTIIKIDDKEYTIDFNNNILTVKNSEIVDGTNKTEIISIGKKDNTRTIDFEDDDQKLEISINTPSQQDEMDIITKLNYSNNEIANLGFETNTNIKFEVKQDIPVDFEENNNILLNDYDGEKVLSILDSLKKRTVKSLEESQLKVNTKLLNNIILYIDNAEKKKQEEEQANIELQKQRFNNQFVLFEGENVEYEYIEKLIKTASQNMSKYEVISGNKIRMYIEKGAENVEKANQILGAISDRHTYDVSIKYSNEGYVEAVDISIYTQN